MIFGRGPPNSIKKCHLCTFFGQKKPNTWKIGQKALETAEIAEFATVAVCSANKIEIFLKSHAMGIILLNVLLRTNKTTQWESFLLLVQTITLREIPLWEITLDEDLV